MYTRYGKAEGHNVLNKKDPNKSLLSVNECVTDVRNYLEDVSVFIVLSGESITLILEFENL